MKNQFLSAALLVLLAPGCSRDPAPPADPQVGAPLAPQRIPVGQAVLINGDLVPHRLVAVALPTLEKQPTLSVSSPGLARKDYSFVHPIETSTRREFARVVTSTDSKAAGLAFPIDAPSGARVILTSRDPHKSLGSVHLRDASGAILDRARDESTPMVLVDHIAGEKSKKGVAPSVDPMPGSIGSPDSIFKPEPGFAALSLPRRILSIDVPAKPGRVTVDIPADVLAAGVEIDVQQPNSAITLTGAPAALQYGFGDTAEIEYTLTNGAAPIDGATLSGTIELPNGERSAGLTFTSKGAGRYVARIPLASADLKYIGVWHLHAKVSGVADGVEFERDMESGFGYAPAHARMIAVNTPEIVRAADGVIDDVKVDVELESVVGDRLGVEATLVYKDAEGKEHAVAVSQTSGDLPAGTGTLTLHFEAKDVALAGVSGPFYLRDLSLVSHAFAVTQHRLGRGLDLSTVAIAHKDIRYPSVFAPAVEEMFVRGDIVAPAPVAKP